MRISDWSSDVCSSDLLLEEIQINALRGRIAREVQDQHLRRRPRFLDRLLQFLEEVDVRRHPHMAHVGAGEHHAVWMDRIRRIRHQHHITGTERRERQMRETRSEERRLGKECVSTVRYWWQTDQ